MLKHQSTYEIMRPETVGAAKTRLVLGKHSGRAALAARLAELGSPLSGVALDRVFARFKALTDRQKQVDRRRPRGAGRRRARDGGRRARRARARGPAGQLRHDGHADRDRAAAPARRRRASCRRRSAPARSTRPTRRSTRSSMPPPAHRELVEFAVHAVTEGIDALGHVTVRVREDAERGGVTPQIGAPRARVFHGAGADTDIVVASAKAYLRAINRMLAAPDQRDQHDQPGAAPPRTESRPPSGRAEDAMTPRTLFEKIWDAHVVAEEPGRAGRALHRSPPGPRGDLAAGVRRAARARPQGPAPGAHVRDDGPLDADRAARPGDGRPRRRRRRGPAPHAGGQLRGPRHRALRHGLATARASSTSSAPSSG